MKYQIYAVTWYQGTLHGTTQYIVGAVDQPLPIGKKITSSINEQVNEVREPLSGLLDLSEAADICQALTAHRRQTRNNLLTQP